MPKLYELFRHSPSRASQPASSKTARDPDDDGRHRWRRRDRDDDVLRSRPAEQHARALQSLDLFNEIQVFGRGLSTLAGLDRGGRRDEGERRGGRRGDKTPTRILDDAGIKEISAIKGVAYVEPSVGFGVYVRANGKLLTQSVGGANIPNASTRFQSFAAGKMIASPTADEAVVSERFIRDFGYAKPADAVGQTLELLAPPSDNKQEKEKPEEEETPNFFGIPLDDPGLDESNPGLEIKKFRIAGVLSTEIKEGAGQGDCAA